MPDASDGDTRSVFELAQSYFERGNFADARISAAQRIELGGSGEETYGAMWILAQSMAHLGEPWPHVLDALLNAWDFRPTRAEPLHTIATKYRIDQRYQLGYEFAERAARIPPTDDTLFVDHDVYAWRAADEQAICASWIGLHNKAFTLCRRILARPDIPDDQRRRIAINRDYSVPAMLDAAAHYPDALLGNPSPGRANADVTVSIIAGSDRSIVELTLNSFLHCCTDVTQVGRLLILDTGLSSADRAALSRRYEFLEFSPADDSGPHLAQLRAQIHGRYWLHLGCGWRFFAPEKLITRLTAVLEAQPHVLQVGVNFTDAQKLTGSVAPEPAVQRAHRAGRYVLTHDMARGPAMFDTTRLDQAGGIHRTDADPVAELHQRATAAALRTATLDEVLCTPTGFRSKRFAIAIVSLPGYPHTEAFREIAETLHHALTSMGHDSVLTNRLDLDDRHTVVFGTNLLARHAIPPPKKAILFNLEQIHYESNDSVWMTPELLELLKRHPVWDYSLPNIERLRELGVSRLTHVPIGYVPELARIAPATEDIDVLFYGSTEDPRRRAVLDELRARGLCVQELFGVYGSSRDAWIARSKIVINIHMGSYKAQLFQIARVSYLLANRRAVVSEGATDLADYGDLASGIAFTDYDRLVDRCVELAADDRARRELAERGFQAFSARNQKTILRRILAEEFS